MNTTFGPSLTRVGIGALALAAVTSVATARDFSGPQIQVGWTVDGDSSSAELSGIDLGSGVYEYSLQTKTDSCVIEWAFLVTDNGAAGGFQVLAPTLGIINLLDQNSTVALDIVLPVNLGTGMAMYGGSVGGSLSSVGFGGYLATIDDSTPLWNTMVDGASLASLFDGPFELTCPANNSIELAAQSFGDPIPGLEYAAAQESMSAHLNFILGARSTVTFTSNYVAQIPAPAGLALLGVAGLAHRRRRD